MLKFKQKILLFLYLIETFTLIYHVEFKLRCVHNNFIIKALIIPKKYALQAEKTKTITSTFQRLHS